MAIVGRGVVDRVAGSSPGADAAFAYRHLKNGAIEIRHPLINNGGIVEIKFK